MQLTTNQILKKTSLPGFILLPLTWGANLSSVILSFVLLKFVLLKFILIEFILLSVSVLWTGLFWSTPSYALDETYITPTYIRTITNPYEQYNDVNPTWSANGEYISFERYDMNSHSIVLSDQTGKIIQTIIAQGKETSELDLLFSSEEDVSSYNTGISWSPNQDEFVFVSSGKSNNFDLFIGKTGTDKTRRLTFHTHKDNQAQWSPINENILFISAREGNAGLYMINAQTSKVIQLLSNQFDTLHPVWSPDGKRIAFMVGVNSAYQIYVINNIDNPEQSLQKISQLYEHNIRPSWSPDGKKLAYFSFDPEDKWNINIAKLDEMNSTTETANLETSVAFDVIQNSSTGPTWLPDSKNIAYIKNETSNYNPIYIIDTESRKNGLFLTNTNMNMDLSCSTNGVLAFQTQDRQWSRVYIAGIPGFKG